MQKQVSFILCTESGPLEQMSILLVESLRAFGGRFSNCRVHSFQPRANHAISRDTQLALDQLGVVHHQEVLNHQFPEYPLANKVFACAYAEQHLESELLVWLDSDKIILDEPNLLDLPQTYDVAARPIDTPREGSDLRGDDNTPFWKSLYQELRVESPGQVKTAVDGSLVAECWNTGLVVTRRSRGLFTLWEKNFRHIMQLGIMPRIGGNYFVEQSVFAATVSASKSQFLELPWHYNYPADSHGKVLCPPQAAPGLESITTLHYHHLFRQANWEEQLSRVANGALDSSKMQWLTDRLSRLQSIG
jgi:hypothetical protein